MYQEHFGLKRPPFRITPDTSLFFEGSQRGAALDALVYAIKSGEGIIKVVGEVGSGKTMLCRMLEVRLADDIDVVYIANPSLSPDNILHVIAHELQLDVDNDMSKVDVMQKIQAHLLQKHADNRQVVLFVEEAQSMPIETLEEIRLLSNLETDENKLLQMVLFGQPELDEKLSSPNIRQLKERITHSFRLTPFPPDDTLQYLNFRLRAVGYKGPDLFNRKTARVIKNYSDGLTRRINILADKAMLAAFSEGSHTVTAKHVKSAARDSEFNKIGGSHKGKIAAVALVLVVLALAGGYYLGMQNGSQPGTGQPAAPAALPDQGSSKPTEPAQQVPAAAEEVSDLLGERLEKTRQWLAQANDRHYSIQLFMALKRDARKVEAFLEDMPEMLDFTKIYIYETVINGRHWYSVVYNDFATQSEAIKTLNELPASLRASEPYLRRIKALKKEIIRNTG
ncbi:MAG TPA: general secretion pathway protein [Gammaproteobacteria bacterium]|nr:general secretion pathway protein [Gammaproteobacteria bacterium]